MELTKKQKALIRKKALKKRRDFEQNYPQIQTDINRIVANIDSFMYRISEPSKKSFFSYYSISKFL